MLFVSGEAIDFAKKMGGDNLHTSDMCRCSIADTGFGKIKGKSHKILKKIENFTKFNET